MNAIALILNILTMYNVVWSNTNIDIKLDSEVREYFDFPQATLLDSNNNEVNANCYYEKGINRTTLTVVNSKHVKKFNVDYRVVFYDLNITFEQTITFNIIDDINPTIIKIPEINAPVKSKLLLEKDIIKEMIYEDNYYKVQDLIVKINNLSLVDTNKPGSYEIVYEVMDPSYNTTKIIGYYNVLASDSIKIETKPKITHNYGEPFDYLNYFKITDEYDLNPLVVFDDSKVNYDVLGSYPLELIVKNKWGFTKQIKTTLEIIDNIKPTIIIISNVTVNIHKDLNIDFSKYIISVYDNYDSLTISDVEIIEAVDYEKIGKYEVFFNVSDTSNNKTVEKLTLNLKDLEPPTATLIEELELEVKQIKPVWSLYFDFSDNYSKKEEIKITYNDKRINYDVIGKYYLEVSLEDSSKNISKIFFTVNIIDSTKPVVTQIRDIVVDRHYITNFDFVREYFDISDNYTKNSNIRIDSKEKTVINETGIYMIELLFYDESENFLNVEVEITVVDTKAPALELNKTKMVYYIGDEVINFNENIKLIKDDYDCIKDLILEINDNVDYDKIGKYTVTYNLFDKSLNKTTVSIDVYVDIRYENLIEYEDIEIVENTIWEIKKGVTLSQKVKEYYVYPTAIDTKKIGTTEVLYVAYDERGNYQEIIQLVKVVEKKKTFAEKYYLLIIVDGTIIIGISYYITRRKLLTKSKKML